MLRLPTPETCALRLTSCRTQMGLAGGHFSEQLSVRQPRPALIPSGWRRRCASTPLPTLQLLQALSSRLASWPDGGDHAGRFSSRHQQKTRLSGRALGAVRRLVFTCHFRAHVSTVSSTAARLRSLAVDNHPLPLLRVGAAALALLRPGCVYERVGSRATLDPLARMRPSKGGFGLAFGSFTKPAPRRIA